MTRNITDHYSFGGLRARIESGLAVLDSTASSDVRVIGPTSL